MLNQKFLILILLLGGQRMNTVFNFEVDNSINIKEVIRSVLNFLFFIFFTKRFHKYKKAQNVKNVYKNI